jgi:hypothetical protein
MGRDCTPAIALVRVQVGDIRECVLS